jgi:hypothetical protein
MTQYREHVLDAATRLLSLDGARQKLMSLPVAQSHSGDITGWGYITLPEWAHIVYPKGKVGLYVPIYDGVNMDWDKYPWWRGAYDLLNCTAERQVESQRGRTHSYAMVLPKDMYACFDHAWVNRIVLFLRLWWCHLHHADEVVSFGALPKPRLYLTHDVDAVDKTWAIRLKRCAFLNFNALRYSSLRLLWLALKFLIMPAHYNLFDIITQMEEEYQVKSHWMFYGGAAGWKRKLAMWLMDPSYDVTQLQDIIHNLKNKGHVIGLHQSFQAWQDVTLMYNQKTTIEQVAAVRVTSCRQHWLQFSFEHTWAAQQRAGLSTDMTLGWNDRIGFRSGCALVYHDPQTNMRVVPTVLMDSHLYDYARLTDQVREQKIDDVLEELLATGGEAAIIWHPHVFHPDYGWADGYRLILDKMRAKGFDYGLC